MLTSLGGGGGCKKITLSRVFILDFLSIFISEDETKFDDNHENNNDNEDVKEDLRDGALFLAVCRGKLSEGTDFANNSARAVITVRFLYNVINRYVFLHDGSVLKYFLYKNVLFINFV